MAVTIARALAVVLLVVVLAACSDPAASGYDPAATYHCHWADKRACDEYIPVPVAGGTAHVKHAEAEERCEDPADEPNDYGAGMFAEGACATGDALGRCVLMPGYRARRYHYIGFEGVPSPDDPGNNAIAAGCELSGGVYERPPFAD